MASKGRARSLDLGLEGKSKSKAVEVNGGRWGKT
jgi:hypothetical protein